MSTKTVNFSRLTLFKSLLPTRNVVRFLTTTTVNGKMYLKLTSQAKELLTTMHAENIQSYMSAVASIFVNTLQQQFIAELQNFNLDAMLEVSDCTCPLCGNVLKDKRKFANHFQSARVKYLLNNCQCNTVCRVDTDIITQFPIKKDILYYAGMSPRQIIADLARYCTDKTVCVKYGQYNAEQKIAKLYKSALQPKFDASTANSVVIPGSDYTADFISKDGKTILEIDGQGHYSFQRFGFAKLQLTEMTDRTTILQQILNNEQISFITPHDNIRNKFCNDRGINVIRIEASKYQFEKFTPAFNKLIETAVSLQLDDIPSTYIIFDLNDVIHIIRLFYNDLAENNQPALVVEVHQQS